MTAFTSISGGTLAADWPEDYGASGTLGIFCTENFVTDTNVSYLPGDGDSLRSQFVTESVITVASGIATYASYSLPKTDTCTPNTIRYFGRIFDSRGRARNDFLFTDRHLRSSLGNSISELQWAIDNEQNPFTQTDTKPTTADMNSAIAAAILNLAVNQDYVITEFSTLALAVAAMPATGATLVINQATSVPFNITIPSYVTLKFTGKGYLNLTNSVTATIVGPIDAGLTKIFYNALSGQGTISFTGNTVLPEVYPQWWGAVGNGTVDCLASINAAMAAYNRVRIVGDNLVTGPIVVPNEISLYGGQDQNSQNFDTLIADGSLGFSGNYLLRVNEPTGQYNCFHNLQLVSRNINNASYIAMSISKLAETSLIKNISFVIQDVTISKLLYFAGLGPITIETINLAYCFGTNVINDYPMDLTASAGLRLKEVNYLLGTSTILKGINISTGIYGSISGLQVESHPTVAAEPAITLTPGYGTSLRDSRFHVQDGVSNATCIKIMAALPSIDTACYILENIGIDKELSTGTWDKLVVLEDSTAATRSWDTARLVTVSGAQLPQRIIRFTPTEQVFGERQCSYGLGTFRDTFRFESIITNGTLTIPFNPRVGTGNNGAGFMLIAINGRENVTGSDNAALIWAHYSDVPPSAITVTFAAIAGSLSTNWDAAYASREITLTNKKANTVVEIVVSVMHGTTELWPT